jgi:quinol-cytochrome oxidoreductase complex cytochrome b subunit
MGSSELKDKLVAWFEDRFEFSDIREFIRKKDVPIHRHSVWYYLGGLALFFYVIQAATGILLLLYYRPSPDNAHESVRFIMSDVQFGWLIRSVHSWGANLFVGVLFVHMASVFFLKAYRKPRELTWLTGALLFFLALGFGFSGYLLPWDTLSYFATKVGTDIAAVVPLVGKPIARFLRGGDEVSGATLTRFFGFHVAVLPMIMAAVLGLHLYFVQKQGMSVPPGYEEKVRGRRKFFPDFFLHDLSVWLAALAVFMLVATLYPWELGSKADPFASAPAGIRPEWYFLYMFETLKILPSRILFIEGEVLGVTLFSLFFLVLALVPLLDRKAAAGKKSRGFTVAGIIVLLYMLAMTVIGYIH